MSVMSNLQLLNPMRKRFSLNIAYGASTRVMRAMFVVAIVLSSQEVFASANGSLACVVNALGSLPSLGKMPEDMFTHDHEFRVLFRRLTKNKRLPTWAKNLNGVQAPARLYGADDCAQVVVLKVCRPHRCSQDVLVVVYEPERRKIWGQLVFSAEQRLTTNKEYLNHVWLGKPPIEIREMLDQLAKDAY